MRLFIALNLPEKEKARLHQASSRLREAGLPVKWVEPDSYHLTLKFLGEVPPEAADEIERVLSAIAAKASPFPLELGGFGAFPSLRRPRVIWVGAKAVPELRALKHDLEWELAALGFARELRAFHPHVSLGRAAADSAAGNFRGLEDLVNQLSYSAVVKPQTVDLMRSRLSPKGSTYVRLSAKRIGVGSEAGGAAAV